MVEQASRITYESLVDISGREGQYVDSNERLLLGIQRAFERMGKPVPQGGVLVSLGCGKEPYMESLKIFHPDRYVGVDNEDSILQIGREKWERQKSSLGFVPTFIQADAVDPAAILQPGEFAHMVLLLHPATTVSKNSKINQNYRVMMRNWLERMDIDGYFVMTTYDPNEARTILRDEEIRSRVVVYGLADVVDESNHNGNTYIVVLQRSPNTSAPIQLLRVDEYVENELLGVPPSEDKREEAERFFRQEAETVLDYSWPDLKMPKASRRTK